MRGRHASIGPSPWPPLDRNSANSTRQSKIDGPLESSDSFENGVSEQDAVKFINAIDCFVIGSRTEKSRVSHILKAFRERPDSYFLTDRSLFIPRLC